MEEIVSKILRTAAALAIAVIVVAWGIAQGDNTQKKSQDTINISGTIIVKDSQSIQGKSQQATQFYLDENNDGQADYQLQFDSQKVDFEALKDGAKVTINGLMSGNTKTGLPIIQVNDLQTERATNSSGGNY